MDGTEPQVTPESTNVTPEPVVIPESVTALLAKKSWAGLEDLATGYEYLEKKVGTNPINIPIEGDVDGWDSFYKTLGRPETPEGYEIKYSGDVKLDDGLVGGFKKVAYDAGYTPSQVNAAIEYQVKAMSEAAESYQAQQIDKANLDFENCSKALKEKWGNDLEERSNKASQMADKLGITDLLVKKNLDNDPEILEMLDKFNGLTGEDALKPQPSSTTQTKGDEIKEILSSKAFTDQMHPDHWKVLDRFNELNGIIVRRG